MITLRKFLNLPDGTRKRKLMRLVGDFEGALTGGDPGEIDKYRRFFQGLHVALSRGDADTALIDPGELSKLISASYSIHATFAANRLKHILMDELGKVSADWDRGRNPGTGEMADPQRVKLSLGEPAALPPLESGERGLYLDDIRSPYNVGAIFRSAAFFSIRYIILSPETPAPGISRLDRTSMGASAAIYWGVMSREDFLSSMESPASGFAALETGGDDITSASLDGIYWLILGNEELGVHPDILARLSESAGNGDSAAPGIISIGGGGDKASLNVSVACGIALSYWTKDAPSRS